MKRDALFCYDIELPIDFIPKPMDGEVESFELKNLTWVLNKLVEGGSNGYKPNCNIVIIDFLIRLVKEHVMAAVIFDHLQNLQINLISGSLYISKGIILGSWVSLNIILVIWMLHIIIDHRNVQYWKNKPDASYCVLS